MSEPIGKMDKWVFELRIILPQDVVCFNRLRQARLDVCGTDWTHSVHVTHACNYVREHATTIESLGFDGMVRCNNCGEEIRPYKRGDRIGEWRVTKKRGKEGRI